MPWFGVDVLRERLSPHFNRRYKISKKKEVYSHVDFSKCKNDGDILFDKLRKNESYEAMNERAWHFYKLLITRKERCIAIVSHEGILACLLNVVRCSKVLRKGFRNGEARICFMIRNKR